MLSAVAVAHWGISLFWLFYATEKNFLLNQKDFFSETTVKCLEKR